ncbi:MAG TPA: penicillin acylase family protein [Stellaceae bacterium]|nr:penicillin acylase family protein [Stellaceae bacterium]
MIRIILITVLALVVALAGGIYLYLSSSLPQTDGRLIVAGLKAPIRIMRDAADVPLIVAKDDEDAAFGLGFVHAQERLFQMELMRRTGAGRLAEIFGEEALPIDRQMRVLGLYRAAEAEIPFLSPATRRVLAAYAAGVNAAIAARRGALPPAYLLLRFSPEPWRIADSLVWGKLMALLLEGDYRGELLRARLLETIPPADLAVLYPGYPPNAPTTLARLRPLYRGLPVRRLYAALPPAVGPVHASNNWVVDGRHSASGKPLLANDPHLEFAAPGVWFLARLETPTHDIAGATAPGSPFIVIGHNEHIAWGFTSTGSDVEDLYVEKLDPGDPGRYLTPQGSAPFLLRREVIRVRGRAPVALTIRATRHGPVLSDALPPLDRGPAAAPGTVLALSATFTRPDDRSADALYGIDHAADWPSFRAALASFVGPQQNIVYADGGGTIGFIAPGLVPIRKKGDGWLPEPGWTGEYDWAGFIPFAALPQATNPPSGRFVSANNKIVPGTYPYFLGRGWDLPDRARRIATLLDRTPRQSPEASAAIQADTFSPMAARLVPLMARLAPHSARERAALARLRQWNFHMDRDQVAPLLFTAYLREFSRTVLFGRFGAAIAPYWDLKPQVMEIVLTKRQDWCGSPQRGESDPGGGCAARLRAALDRTLAALSRAYGPDMAGWRWGRAHLAHFENPLWSRIPIIADWLTPSIPTPGGYDTLDRGPSDVRDDKAPFVQRFGAGLRMITDLAAPQDARMIVTPGQSGNPLSRHFADLVRRWRDFVWLFPGHARPVSTLVLQPRATPAFAGADRTGAPKEPRR